MSASVHLAWLWRWGRLAVYWVQDEIAAELKTVAGQIDSGFQEALQQMGVVQTGINELLFGSKAILHSLEDLNKQSQQRHEELVRLEEFLAIILEKPLHLPWLTPKREEALPEWNAERIKELFEELEKQGNWQVFYQSFEVVE